MLGIGAFKQRLPDRSQSLPGRETPMQLQHNRHAVLDAPLRDAFTGMSTVQFGMGCFWGAERKFWQQPGVVSTSVGYAGGCTPNPTYREVCSGETGHAEVVQVVFDPARTDLAALLQVFWVSHDPTQGMRQGNDKGTQYRSVIYCDEGDRAQVEATRESYNGKLQAAGFAPITTEIVSPTPEYFFAEDEHQQYLAKNPSGYCGIGGTGICSID